MTKPDTVDDRRSSDRPSKNDLEGKMSVDQVLALRRLESFGWTLRFIRQPLFQDPIAVVIQGNGKAIGILEEDGRLNLDTDIQIRSD